MGRSRGGLTTRIHALVGANGMPITLKLTAVQAHDGYSAAAMLETLDNGDVLLANRANDSDALRIEMAAWRMGQHQTHAQSQASAGLQHLPLPVPQPPRALLQPRLAHLSGHGRSQQNLFVPDTPKVGSMFLKPRTFHQALPTLNADYISGL